jgi:hypothetical protein
MESGAGSTPDLEARVARLESSNRRLVVAIGLLAGFVVGLILLRVVDGIRAPGDQSMAPSAEHDAGRLATAVHLKGLHFPIRS